jgi:hypothetical protein
MGVRTAPDEDALFYEPPAEPLRWTSAVLLALLLLVPFLANGRPIGAGDTRATERVAASLVHERDLDLDEYPEVEPPFARQIGAHRVSIYPVLPAALAAPVFALVSLAADLDETGSALAGKLAASLLSAAAAAVFFVAVRVRRRSEGDAFRAAVVLALGTSVWSTSQALWQHPAAVLFLSVALLFLVMAEDDTVWAGRAGLPLALMVASRHSDVVLAAVLSIAIAIRWPRRMLLFALCAAPVVAALLAYNAWAFGGALEHGFSGSASRFSETWGVGQAGLLVSPAKGLFVFTPVAIMAVVGLVRAVRFREGWLGERFLPAAAGAAALAHLVFIGKWGEWHGGESWGPRMMTDALPLLFLFLPEAMDAFPRITALLAALSVAVQALGAFAYDYRWERLYQRADADKTAALWDARIAPIPFHVRQGVYLLAAPYLKGRQAVVREHPIVFFDTPGSLVSFETGALRVTGSETTFEDASLQRGARVVDGRLRLRGRWDALFLRVTEPARIRPLELRIAGRGRGPLYVGERTFWSDPRFATHSVSGSFLVRHPYQYGSSGGGDLTVTVGRGGGEVEIDWVALVPPGDPVRPHRIDGTP